MARGGYREPANPAPVSGPGALSRRTDGRPNVQSLPDARYGEQQAFREQQNAAPMGSGTGPRPGAGGDIPLDTSGVVGLDAPSQWDDVPVTDGAAEGEGAGPEIFGPGLEPLSPEDRERLASYMPAFMTLASQPGASKQTREFVRRLRGELI